MVASLEKHADQAKSKRLKASKKAWNAVVRLLRAKLSAFQKSINGHGDANAQLPEVDLTDPFPVEFHTYLASIVDDYDKVIKGADFVMDLQDDFSVNRRKSQKELREVAAELDNHDQKIAEASWWGSRAWAWFALHRLGKDARRVRLRMLSFTRRSVSALNTIEYHFTSKAPGSDVQAIVGLTRFINMYIGGYLNRLAQLKQIDLKGLEDSEAPPQLGAGPSGEPSAEDIGPDIVGGPPPAAGPDLDMIEAQLKGQILKARITRINKTQYDSNLKKEIIAQFERLKDSFKKKKDDTTDVYQNLIALLDKAEADPSVKSAETDEEEYRKIAQNVLRRWVSRKRLEWDPSKSDDLKIQISDELRDTVRELKELMDIIESLDRATADIEEKTKEISVLLKSAAKMTLTLADDYRMQWRMEEDKKERPARLEESVTSKLKKLMGML